MKNRFISGFLCGAVIFGAAGALAATYTAVDNPFPIQLNGKTVQIEGYNINDRTYFQLRDIASVIGGFEVGFQNGKIQLSTDGYVYPQESVEAPKINPDLDWIYEHKPTNLNYNTPQFNINTDAAKSVNSRIDSEYAKYIAQDSDVGALGYDTFRNANLLALVTKGVMTYNDVTFHTAHTINLTTGGEVTNSMLAEIAGTDMDAVLNVVGDKIEENLNSWKGKISADEFNRLTARAYSPDCYGENMPMYLNSDGHLIAIAKLASPAADIPTAIDTGFKIQ